MSDEDFEDFYATLKKPLPSTFRITGTKNNALQIRKFIEEQHVANMQNVIVDGVKYDPPAPVSWYPDQLCWEITCPRGVLRNSPEYASFQKFLVAENETGNISRQELVSMVPPLLMDIQPHQRVLDMCAAPGSKTGQIVEAIHANDKLNEMPAGLVVANDADYKRSQLLVHQLKRLQSPCFMATNHDAAHFPNITVSDNGVETPWQFDRVLCDVPCSGDGTLRKNAKVWKQWSQGAALALHSVQVQIFLRGAQLVKMGGRIVYSTCSFNPIENEAVVAEVLRLSEGALELKDVSDELPGLIRRPGLKTWKVMTRENQFISSVDEIENARSGRKFPKSAFPPENPDPLHLERCLRIYPHDQNTGGFFVAVFEKVKPMTVADRMSVAKDHGQSLSKTDIETAQVKDETLVKSITTDADTTNDTATTDATKTQDASQSTSNDDKDSSVPSKRTATNEEPAKPTKKSKKDVQAMKEAPFDMMAPNNPDLLTIKSFYGLNPAFPMDQFLLRSDLDTKNRQIYFVSKAVKTVLESKQIKRLHIVNTGVRLFARQGSLVDTTDCAFRISSEGVPLIEQYIEDHRSVHVGLDDLKVLLVGAFPMITEFSPDTQANLNKLSPGGIIFIVDVSTANLPADTKMMLPVWRAKLSVNVLLNKHDKKSLCQRLFGVTPEPIPVHIKDKSQPKDEEPSTTTIEDSADTVE
ncbi:S-adenosyl-L-methionine-dependent methyltransferase [Chlamydoabsidia padenii]|nr:S-adenosyl-L-methionine-dependent methyltransferase [Chlamydoabsidia padenii]